MRNLKRILLVDDDPELLASATQALAGLGGYTVKPCRSASDAAAQSPSFRPDLILLGLPKALREVDATDGTPVVLMTAGSVQIARGEEQGCLGVIAKPFDPAVLPERLEGFWERHSRQLAEVYRREFEALRRAYVDELPEKIGAMRTAVAVLAAEGWDRPVLESLFHLAHRMAGASGLYRLSALSQSAQALEDGVSHLLSGPTWPPTGSPGELARLVKAVDRTARGEAGRPRPIPRERRRRE